jgi:hypothetical protein
MKVIRSSKTTQTVALIRDEEHPQDLLDVRMIDS